MILYGLNNIVKCGSYIYYIDMLGERFHLRNETSTFLYGVTLDDDEKELIEDIEMSDWVLDALFQRKYYHDDEEGYYWDLGNGDYTIEKDDEGLYFLSRGRTILVYFDTVRELQNAYNLFGDYEVFKEDIDTKLKKLFKLI